MYVQYWYSDSNKYNLCMRCSHEYWIQIEIYTRENMKIKSHAASRRFSSFSINSIATSISFTYNLFTMNKNVVFLWNQVICEHVVIYILFQVFKYTFSRKRNAKYRYKIVELSNWWETYVSERAMLCAKCDRKRCMWKEIRLV